MRSRVADVAHYVFFLFDDALLYASEDRTQVLPLPSPRPAALSRILYYAALKYAHGESLGRAGTDCGGGFGSRRQQQVQDGARCVETAQLTRHGIWRGQVGSGGTLNLKRKFNIGNGGGKIAVTKSREGGQVPLPFASLPAACRLPRFDVRRFTLLGVRGMARLLGARVTWRPWRGARVVWSCHALVLPRGSVWSCASGVVWLCARGAVCLPCFPRLRSLPSYPWHPCGVCSVPEPAGALPCARATCNAMH